MIQDTQMVNQAVENACREVKALGHWLDKNWKFTEPRSKDDLYRQVADLLVGILDGADMQARRDLERILNILDGK